MQIKRLSILGLLLGLILATLLITWQGWQRITEVLHTAGWAVFWLPLYFLLPLACALFSWWYLFPRDCRPKLGLTAYCIWINFAVNWLLPVAQVGGEIARVRLLLKREFAPGVAIASIIGDQTLQIVSQALYAFTGVALLGLSSLWRSGAPSVQAEAPLQSGQLIAILAASIVVLTVISVGLYWVQQQGLFKLFSKISRKFPKRFSKSFAQLSENEIGSQATTIDEAVLAMYHRRDRLFLSIVWRLGFRVFAAGETWLALHFLGHPVGLIDAIILESLGQAIRSAAFLLPGGLGAQEGGIMLIGLSLGLPGQIGLSLSLCKRIRELVIGIPGLLALQIEESHGILTKSS